MSIFFCGDPHGNFAHIARAVQKFKPTAIVLLGDIEPQEPLQVALEDITPHTEVWWIHGNHDTDNEANAHNLFASEMADRNLHGRVVEIDGQRIAGLGGVFRSKVWRPPEDALFHSYAELANALNAYRPNRERRTIGKFDLARWTDFVERASNLEQATRDGKIRQHLSSIFPDVYLELVGQRADILVTHEAPGCHPNGFDALDELARSMRVAKSFHGHQHDRLDYSGQWATLGFQAHGVGFRGIVDQDGHEIHKGDFDEQRAGRMTRIGCSHEN